MSAARRKEPRCPRCGDSDNLGVSPPVPCLVIRTGEPGGFYIEAQDNVGADLGDDSPAWCSWAGDDGDGEECGWSGRWGACFTAPVTARRATPMEVRVILDCHALASRPENATAPAYRAALLKFARMKLITPDGVGWWNVTDTGAAWVKAICATVPMIEERKAAR